MLDRSKKPSDTIATGGFGRRQTPVAGAASDEPSVPAGETSSPGFGRRATPVPGASAQQDPAAPNDLQRASNAGNAILRHLMQAYRNERGVHVETIVGAAAVLAGEFALRASMPWLPESGWIAGAPADALIYGGFPDKRVTMWNVIQVVLLDGNPDRSQLPDIRAIALRASESLGAKSFPPKLSIPSEHWPHEFSPNACPRFRGAVASIAREHGLSAAETGLALAFTLGVLIRNARQLVPAEILATLAAELMIAMTRIAPRNDEI